MGVELAAWSAVGPSQPDEVVRDEGAVAVVIVVVVVVTRCSSSGCTRSIRMKM